MPMNNIVTVPGSVVQICDACGRTYRTKEATEGEKVCGTCQRLINLGLDTVESIQQRKN